MSIVDPTGKKHSKHVGTSVDEGFRRVLLPFLARQRKKLKLTDIKEEYRHVYQQTKPGEVLAKLAEHFRDSQEIASILNDTSEIIKNFTNSEGMSLYTVDPSNEYIVLNSRYRPRSDRFFVRYPIEPGTTFAAYVAYVQEVVVVDDVRGDLRFPDGIPGAGNLAKSALCLPVLTSGDGDLIAVIELHRSIYQDPYNANEVQTAVAVTTWMGAAIHQNNQKLFVMKECELSKYLISLLQLFFSGVVPFDKFVSDIIIFAKTTVGADRGLFYFMTDKVVEGTDQDILAEVYEEALDLTHEAFKKKTIQRFCNNCPGIAGHVARYGKSILLEDAYLDERFIKTNDTLGYRTRSLISVPVKSSLSVYGVLTLVNKKPRFTERDEEILQTLASYSVLACQFSYMSDELRKMTHRYDGQTELLKIQIQPCPHDREFVYSSAGRDAEVPEGYFGFDWYLFDVKKSVDYVLFSFAHCLGSDLFEHASLLDFVLMTKKCYRPNPYHNFVHAFTVFHCTFNIVRNNPDLFTVNEKVALFVATLCHDVDHFGFTNSFLGTVNNWLANLYQESCLEHHHFDICMMLVETSNLFSKFTAEEFHELRKLIEALILATDLVSYFKIRGHLNNIIKTGVFDWDNQEHRLLCMHIMMNTADISGQCKPFPIAKHVTECLYLEFYNQGDIETKNGIVPLSMMDRNQKDQIPVDQIQFLTIICVPCLETIVALLPNTAPLLKMCLDVRLRWKTIRKKQQKNTWFPEEAMFG